MNRSRASEMDDASPNACVCVNIIVCIPFHSAFSRLPESKNNTLCKSEEVVSVVVVVRWERSGREKERDGGSSGK